jgi:hypothetical protein
LNRRKKQDLPVLCFRSESNEDIFEFLKTNKLGDPEGYKIKPGRDYEIMVEYIFQVRSAYGVPHTVARLLSIPRFVLHDIVVRLLYFTTAFPSMEISNLPMGPAAWIGRIESSLRGPKAWTEILGNIIIPLMVIRTIIIPHRGSIFSHLPSPEE